MGEQDEVATIGTTLGDLHAATAGLRGHLWRLLARPDLTGTATILRAAAAEALRVARHRLAQGDPEGAIRALDAGRGLAVFAATEVRTVATRLDLAGKPDLARRWRAAATVPDPNRLPAELRREVLTVLASASPPAAQLMPPTLGEIQQALAAVDADALVYLIPGHAVIAPAEGPATHLALPHLAEPIPATAGRAGLDRLCGWAWDAAIGPLVSELPGLVRPPLGRPYRIVLVTAGKLARIPWSAARRGDGAYAIELVAISQAVSARMLCHSAAQPPVLPSPAALVVGDPSTVPAFGGANPGTEGRADDLPAARLEAYAIGRLLYPAARYVGRRPGGTASLSGAGTLDQLRAWLTTTSPAAGATLHLACPGLPRAGADRPESYLLVAGGERLTVVEILALAARAQRRPVDLVVLAAGRPVPGSDEAYGLGTAFLAGGVRSVVAPRWGVPDGVASGLLFMVHWFRRAGQPAWAALRDAQLWMLDPARTIPLEMPPELVPPPTAGDPAGWAAFVHTGR